MRLSKLHINGFKSFPDRAELGFDDGVTAIVGPNGCGKSNVVDAITWVLGEQSAKSLRGERMEDVIFNGSDARKPTAAAEVRLRLTNVAQAAMASATAAAPDDALAVLDGATLITRDVEIGRRLYRSGESEYLIDGEVCRLRDIHDLLMDSGLGVKAYAVIEQGKIGQILSSRPAERRALIEEAAGVTKYKSRRRAAELKLEAAQQNLTRIDDIIFEVEKQRGALKRQAARARRYRRLREELRRWEQVQLAHRHEHLVREIEDADGRLADARAREAAAAAHLAELDAALEALRLALTEAEDGATSTREEMHAVELEIGRRQQQIEFDKQQIEDLGRQAQASAAEAGEIEGRREPARLAIEAQREAGARVRLALGEAAARLAACEHEYAAAVAAVQAIEQESDAVRAAVLASGNTLAALAQARDHAALVKDRVAAERERLDIEARDLRTEADRARADHARAESDLAQARSAVEAAVRARSDADAELARQRSERERLGEELVGRQRAHAAHEARLRSLEELQASRATFGDAARLLLGAAGASLCRHGAVVDHLSVERSYERAVDALLGDRLQHVLVERADDVTDALRVLAGHDAGRCGFLVLADATGADAQAIAAPAGAVTLASVVHATGPFAPAVTRALGAALIVPSFDEARRLARDVDVPVAAMTGEVFRGPALVEGGSRQTVRGILESRAEVLALRDEVEADARDVRRIAAAVSDLDASIPGAEAALAERTADHHDREKAVVGLEALAARTADELARVSKRLDVVSVDLRRAAEEETSADQRREEAVAAIVGHEVHKRDAEGRLGHVLAQLQAARESVESRLRLVTEARTEEARLAERVSGFDAEEARLLEAARELDERLTIRQQEILRTETRQTELRQSIQEGEQRFDEGVRTLDGLRVRVRELDERVVALRGEFTTRDHGIRVARHDLETIRTEVMRSEVAHATAASDLSHLASVCLEAMGTPIDAVVAEVARMEEAGELVAPARRLAAVAAPDEDEEAEAGDGAAGVDAGATAAEAVAPDAPLTPEAVIADLKKKVERLGPVNMMAIEQFDELETRHTFLTTQRKDLLDSIAQTGEAIRKIDKTTRERFDEAFHVINANFETTFATLFGGGRAGLVLIDQDNDPETGIDIIAQPPGKRLQNVQLLSGGEKALTAMALMFAIFKYRPSPFCLLDEIDAPLDDANIGRFVEMLLGMQGHTQFILITHNRKTMEIANRLYGVTMEEPGVSKLISVQLN